MSPAKVRTRNNHEATAPPKTRILHLHEVHLAVFTKVNIKVPHIFETDLRSAQKVIYYPQMFRLTALGQKKKKKKKERKQ